MKCVHPTLLLLTKIWQARMMKREWEEWVEILVTQMIKTYVRGDHLINLWLLRLFYSLLSLLTAQDIEHYLRAFLLKINTCNTLLLLNPKGTGAN